MTGAEPRPGKGPAIVQIRLGQLADVGWLAGFPGITPLELHGDLFTARVADPAGAVEQLRAAGFPEARLERPNGPARQA